MKHFRLHSYIILLAALLFAACSDEVGLPSGWWPSLSSLRLTLSNYEVAIPAKGGTQTVEVTATNTGWKFSDSSNSEWVTLTPESGDGSATVTLTAQPNIDPTTGRSVSYAFTTTAQNWGKQPFRVTQDAPGFYVRPAKTSITVDAEAQTFDVAVEANATWTAECVADRGTDGNWISATISATTISIQVTANTTSKDTDRTGKVILTCGNATEIISIIQNPPLSPVPTDELQYEAEGGKKKLEVKSDEPWTANCSQSWVTLSPSEGKAGSTTMTITAAANGSTESRTANIYLKVGKKSYTIPMRQEGLFVRVSVNTLPSFDQEGGSKKITIESNTNWTVIEKPDFVTVNPTNGSKGTNSVTVTASEYNQNLIHSGDIVFGNPSVTGLQAKVHVEQHNLEVDEQVVTVGSIAGSSHKLTLIADQSWTTAFKYGTWAHVSPTSGTGSATLILTADDNPSTKQRDDVLTITPSETNTSRTVNFIQKGKDLTISTSTLAVHPQGGTSDPLVVTTDGTFKVSQTGEWFAVHQNGNVITVSAPANTERKMLTGTLIISMTGLPVGESLERNVTISQNSEGIFGDGFSEDHDWNLNPGKTDATITIGGFSDDQPWDFPPENGWNNGHEYVDLGLSVKWATCNIGATVPEQYGDYFAWGETKPKSIYTLDTYFDSVDGSRENFRKYYNNGGKTTLAPEDDAAHVNWGKTWRMPTIAEMQELYDNCTWTMTTVNGIVGFKAKSKVNRNTCFFPVPGIRHWDFLVEDGKDGYYWSSSLSVKDSDHAGCLFIMTNTSEGDIVEYNGWFRDEGASIRPVCP